MDKIVGPGNLYVTAAKRLVAFDCAIDMLAGPTEIVVTSERGNADEIAADIVAQAEHDPEALAIFITTREELGQSSYCRNKNPQPQESLLRVRRWIRMAWSFSRQMWRKRAQLPIDWLQNISPWMRRVISIG